MIHTVRYISLFVLCLVSIGAQAACVEDNERFRSQYQISVTPGEATLLRVQPYAEDVLLDVIDEEGHTVRFAHPGGANIPHVLFLEENEVPQTLTLCVVARFTNANPGRIEVNVTPLSLSDSASDITESDHQRYRLMTQAAMYWGENTAAGRAKALSIYQQHSLFADQSGEVIANNAALFEVMALIRRSSYQEALSRLDRLNSAIETNDIFGYKRQWQQGHSYLRLGRHTEAIQFFQAATATIADLSEIDAQHADDTASDLAEIRLAMAEAYLALDDREQAQQQIALAEGTAETDYRLMGRLYDILGYLAIVNSQQPGLTLEAQREALSEAIDVMLTGRFFSETSGDAITQAAFENNLGFAYDQLGEYHRAFQHYRQILDMVTPEEDPLVYRYAYSNLGKLYQYTADYPRSASYYRQAIALSENSSGLTSTTRCALGSTLRFNGDITAALAEHELCLLEAERINRPSTLALARIELAEDYLALGDDNRAWRYARLAWEQGEDGVPTVIRTRIERRFAWFLQQQGRSTEASAILKALISMHDTHRLVRVDQIDNLGMAMQIASDQGNHDQALAYGLEAIALIEQQYEQLESARLGAAWSARAHDIYVKLSELHLARYQAENDPVALTAALNMVERSRAISLRQQFALQQSSRAIGAETSTAAQAQIAMISQIANAHALSSSVDSADIHLPVSYYQHHDVLSFYRLNQMQQLPLPAALEKEAIQAQLEPDQSVLYYLMGDTAAYVFILSHDDLQVKQLGRRGDIDQWIQTAREALGNPNVTPYAALSELSAILLPDMNLLRDGTDLTIVPHGALHALPFAALPMTGTSTYTPLTDRFSVNTVPSLTAWLMEKPGNNVENTADIAIFADPVFDSSQLQETLAYRDVNRTRAASWTRSLQRLEATAIEARNITRLFATDRSVLFTGAQASRSKLARSDVQNAKVLHIATHGYFNEASDDNVGLGFSVIDENGDPDSGFVTLAELFSYEFNNQLVVISGCDTSMGKALAGEGMMGISRGFVAQGAQHVIATLWPVSDRASAEFMSIFYQQLLETGHVNQALQATQQAFISNPAYRDPYYWGAYVLTSVSRDQSIDFPAARLAHTTH